MMGTGGRERGGGDETASNVKSFRNDEVGHLSDKKSIANSRATHSYLSNRLSRQRGGGRSINAGTLPDPVTGGVQLGGDTGTIASVKSSAASRKLNSQGNKRDILSQRKGSTHDAANDGAFNDTGSRGDAYSRSVAKVGSPTYDVPPNNVSRS